MRAPRWILAVIGGIGAVAAAASPGATAPPSASNKVTVEPAGTVREALLQELAGNNAVRGALLQQIVDQDPEFAAARWHLGYLKVNDAEWVPYRRFVDDEDERWHHLYLYRRNRAARGDTVQDHLFLADGARDRGMRDEERAHLTRILELDWNHAEARQRLGHRRIEGVWVSPERMELVARDFDRWVLSLEEWKPRIEELAQRLGLRSPATRDAAEMELFAIRDPAAIPAVELLFARGDETRTLRYLDWLAQIDAWEAAVALARQSVLSSSTRVRVRARGLLESRRLEDYAPALLATLRIDESRIERFLTWDGRFVFAYTESRERQDARYERVALVSCVPVVTFNVWSRNGTPLTPTHGVPVQISSYVNDARVRAVVDRGLNDLHRSSVRRFSQADQVQSLLNERVNRALQQVTGRQVDEAAQWWDWWIAHNQVYIHGEKPAFQDVYEEDWYVEDGRRRRRRPQPGPVVNVRSFSGSCFAAGTPVVTEYGPTPIDEIALGDRVLAQDVETGQIAFKPVFKSTVRPPVELLTITTKDDALTCTGGHPFWINGLGWRYARELEPGMQFHSVDGSREIISIGDSGRTERAYNLVVADYHNYFVGENRILSHDNSPRSPTNALLPGLMPDWSATVDQSHQDAPPP